MSNKVPASIMIEDPELDEDEIEYTDDNDEALEAIDTQKRIEAAKRLFDICSNSWKDVRTKALADLEFYQGNQWDKAVLAAGANKKEPTLSVNRLPQFVKQIENELRNREINISVVQTDEEGSDKTANILNGLIRHIQNDSKATQHYIHAAGESGALVPGFGFLKVDIEPVSSRNWSDNKKLMINSVFDPFTILPDFTAQTVDFRDANYWFEIVDYSESEYKQEFPHSKMASLDVDASGLNAEAWGLMNSSEQTIRVVRYWYKEQINYVKYLLEDGTEVDSLRYERPIIDQSKSDAEMDGRLPFPTKEDNGASQKVVSRTKEVVRTDIKWMDINAVEILREGEWAGQYFPFVAVCGPQTVVNGLRDIRGIIRYAKDSQKMLNYMASSIARRIGSANKSPFIADKRSIAPYERQWTSANTENWSVLLYDAFRDNPAVPGELVANPVPQRADQTSQITDLLQASQHWNDELKATIGIYDAGLGATPNEQSGIAIKTLAQQGNNSNLHFSENLVSAIEQLGCILIDLIPKVYNTPRTIRIVNPDSTEEIVKINQMFNENGKNKKYDLNDGEYGVKVTAGPAYATRQAAALEQILELTRVDPQTMPILQDIMVGAMDFPGADIAKERLLKLFAANFPMLQDEQDEEVPPRAQAALSQQQMMIKKLTEELTVLHQEYEKASLIIKTDTVKVQGSIALEKLKAQNDERIELMRAEREKLESDRKVMMEEVKARLDHTEKMFSHFMPHMVKQHNDNKKPEGNEGQE
jgi:hypothetical protein